ncbi:MAG: hypothetical protein ACE5G3_03850, partial [Gammaproteobacteria bacterium]
ANTPGRRFAPALLGDSIDWDDTVFFEYIDTRVIQTRDWKYTGRFLAAPNELYDLAHDPGETRNLIDDPDYAAIAARLEARLTAFFDRYADPRYDIWHGGTAKATLFYGGRNAERRKSHPVSRPPARLDGVTPGFVCIDPSGWRPSGRVARIMPATRIRRSRR